MSSFDQLAVTFTLRDGELRLQSRRRLVASPPRWRCERLFSSSVCASMRLRVLEVDRPSRELRARIFGSAYFPDSTC